MSPPPLLDFDSLELTYLSHYHQAPGEDPVPVTLPARHERIELVTGGRGWVRDGNEWREVVPGDLVWNRPRDDTIGRSDWERPYRCLGIGLRSRRRQGFGVPRFSHWPDRDERNAFVAEVVKGFYDPGFDRRVLLHYAVGRLLFQVYRSRHLQEEARLPEPLRRVLKWIEENYARPCPVGLLASRAGWSAAHLHHAFRLHLRQSPHRAVMGRRIRAAQEQLASTGHPIKRIAAECGFADASSLVHAFRASQGMTPTAYRRRSLG